MKTTGSLRGWTIEGKADKILVPTLVVAGVDDQAQEEAQRPWFDGVPKVKWVPFAHSSHVPFFEEPDHYFQTVANFLRDVSPRIRSEILPRRIDALRNI